MNVATTTGPHVVGPAGSLLGRAAELVKIARPGFWPTHLWFFLLPLGLRDMFGSTAFWAGCVYVCFPLGLLSYGWNDLGDAETDALNPRKDSWLFGARPDAWMRQRLPALIVLSQLPFAALFVWLAGPKTLLCLFAIVLANGLYNAPRFGWKQFAGLDLLNQVGYLLVFVLASWLCGVPQLSWPAMVFSALFAMHSHLFGQLMDLEEDAAAGRRSTAVRLGVRPSKLLLAAMMLAEAGIAYVYFHGMFVSLFMGAGAAYFLGDALFGPRRYPVWFTKLFFAGWNVVVIATMHFVWRYGVFLSDSP
ncbi:MAG: UbiA family prenyltransferase [Sandaracinaceae bacterium]